MSKVQQAIYLATVRLQVMDLAPMPDAQYSTHWINDDAFVDPLVRYCIMGYDTTDVARALIDAYRAVMKEAVGK